MWNSFSKILTTSSIRVATITLFCLGFTYASTIPYQSIIGIDQLGMSTWHYSILMIIMAVTGMIGSFVMGYFSDRTDDRKKSILITLAVGAVGFGVFSIFPSLWSFIFCLVLISPISGSTYGQLFAVIRSQTSEFGSRDAASINSVVRSIYAASWILVPGLVGLYIATRKNISDSYSLAAAAFAFCFLIYLAFGKSVKNSTVGQGSAWAGFKTALSLVAGRQIFLRVLALALIATPQPTNAALLPLFITHLPGGTTADVGLLAGLVAGLEIPFMLLGGYFNRQTATWKIILVAGLAHAAYLFGLGFVTATWQIYALAIINAAGAAIMLSLHLSYLQDLMPDRPGLGTSLLSIGSLLNKGFGAVVFASAGTVIGFSGAAWFGVIVTLAGCVLLYGLDAKGGSHARSLL